MQDLPKQTGSGPGSTDADTPLSQAGKHSRWTSRLCLKLWVIRKESCVAPSETKRSCRFRILLKSRRNKGHMWESTNSLLTILAWEITAAPFSPSLPRLDFELWKGLKPPKSSHPTHLLFTHLQVSEPPWPLSPFSFSHTLHKYLLSINFAPRSKDSNLKVLTRY